MYYMKEEAKKYINFIECDCKSIYYIRHNYANPQANHVIPHFTLTPAGEVDPNKNRL